MQVLGTRANNGNAYEEDLVEHPIKRSLREDLVEFLVKRFLYEDILELGIFI